MQTIFIKEEEVIGFKDKLVIAIKRIFNKIEIINCKNEKILVIPISKKTKLKKYIIKRLTRKILKFLNTEGTNRIVLSEYLKEIVDLKNGLYSENINILDGRVLFKYLNINILNYILNIKNERIENSEVWVLVNDFNEVNKEIIIEIAKKVKMINIITNNIGKFKKIEKYLYNEYGINLSILNNKRTSLIKAKIIINIDFPVEIINQYRIYNKAIIINNGQKIEIPWKRFNGINVNYFNINIPEKYKIKGFKEQEIYESKIINYNYNQAFKIIERDKISMQNLIGNKRNYFRTGI